MKKTATPTATWDDGDFQFPAEASSAGCCREPAPPSEPRLWALREALTVCCHSASSSWHKSVWPGCLWLSLSCGDSGWGLWPNAARLPPHTAQAPPGPWCTPAALCSCRPNRLEPLNNTPATANIPPHPPQKSIRIQCWHFRVTKKQDQDQSFRAQ